MPQAKLGSSSSGERIADGVFLDSATISDVGVLTGTTPPKFERPIDIGLELFYHPAHDATKEFSIRVFGTPKRDDAGVFTGWGSAFKVIVVLNEIALFDGDIPDNMKIPEVVLKGLIGKTMYFIRYAYKNGDDGKLKYSTYGAVFGSRNAMYKHWMEQVAKGYPKDYIGLNGNGKSLANVPAPVVEEEEESVF